MLLLISVRLALKIVIMQLFALIHDKVFVAF